MATPTKMEVAQESLGEPAGLRISWDDGHSAVYPWHHLRKACPCAVCKGERTPFDTDPLALPVFKPMAAGSVNAKDLYKIGRYAIGIKWADGHETGIYGYDYLRKMCPCDACVG